MILVNRITILVFTICIMASCSFGETLEETLNKAGENRIELEKVLSHYKNDSLKYQAACFLIENMNNHVFSDGPELKKYLKYYECVSGRHNKIDFIIDSLTQADGEFVINKLQKKSDLQYIDSDYLIDNIEWAFKVWQEQPWGENVDFKQFCEYILPYRVGDEVPVSWRENLYCIYNPMLDNVRNLPKAKDPLFVAQVLLDSLKLKVVTFTSLLPAGPHVGPNVVNWRSGTCRELADMVTYVLRSIGIPCTMDYILRGDNNANHYWNVVVSKDNKEYMIEFPGVLFRPVEEYDAPKGKVYRKTFSLNNEDLRRADTYSFLIHPLFRNPLFIDVTSSYGKWNRDVILSSKILYNKSYFNDLVYLCLSRRQEWIPVAWATLKNDSIFFPNVEGGVVGCLGVWDGFKFTQSSDPFLIEKETNEIRYFTPDTQLDTVRILYKFPLFNETYTFRMPGGVFEGSNDRSFKLKDTLHLIKKAPERLYNTVCIDSNNKKYRYVRYKGGKGSHCNIAEIEFYTDNNSLVPLSGEIIGTPGCWQKDGSHEYTMAFDGDPYTSFDYIESASGWTGLDLGIPYEIKKIRYAPRNRDNFIRKGDNYELFYWKGEKWNSSGLIQAQSDSLVYVVPRGALLYLKNHSRGKDERIFEYVEDKIKFW